MKGFPHALLFTVLAGLLSGCLIGGGGGGGDDDDSGPSGGPKPPVPKVAYETWDSVIHVRIQGRQAGEARKYWIYRDEVLLDQPSYLGGDSLSGGPFLYRLVDSVKTVGEYTYRVRYGAHPDSLSDPSEPYVFAYAGPSPSGHVNARLLYIGAEAVQVDFFPRRNIAFRKAIIERRVGATGEVMPIDTILFGGGSNGYNALDTHLVVDDVWLYYRARVYDFEENWLEPSPWDSLEVKNRTWNYLPQALVRNHGTDVRVTMINPLSGMTGGSATYLLYRNDREDKEGKDLVDSARAGSLGGGILLADIPGKTGTYWYWVEVRDGRGRTSVRSDPQRVVFTGRAKGPAISSLQSSSSFVHVYFAHDPEAVAYVLERAQDTSKGGVAVDTLAATGQTSFADRPPAGGTWHYRLVSLFSGDRRSDPGDWSTVPNWYFEPTYQYFTAVLANRGDRIEVSVPSPSFSATLVLYRSGHPTGRDSTAVDTLALSAWGIGGVLEDRPAVGTWYYRVFGVPTSSQDLALLRSEILRAEFTGRAAGPPVTGLSNSYRYVSVTFSTDPEAMAYILERASDEAADWKVVDTIPARSGYSTLTVNNRPPATGYWRYRVRSIRTGLATTDPGTSMRTQTPWSDAVTYENTLQIQVTNSGTQVALDGLSSGFEYEMRILRSDKPGYADGKLIATVGPTQSSRYTDQPPLGTWYYWVERHYSGTGTPPGVVYRSTPVKVVFTGAPEITTLSSSSVGITVAFPPLSPGDTLQVWRSKTAADDDSAFELLATVTDFWQNYIVDGVDKDKAMFYHYRLRLLRGGETSGPGGVKSLFYDPESPGPFF